MLWIIAQVPFRIQLIIGRIIGWFGYYLLREKRRIAEINIRLCFPELDQYKQTRLVKKTFNSIGIGLCETAFSWWGSNDRLRPLAHIEGLEHVREGLKDGKGVILLAAHFTSLDICGRLLSLKLQFYPVAKRAHNSLFEAVMSYCRNKHYPGVIERKNIRGMLKLLRENKVCWYAQDQDLGTSGSTFVPFMGNTAATLTSTSRIAATTGAKVISFQFIRDHGNGYNLKLSPLSEAFPSGDDVEDARYINSIIESQIKYYPDQYLWIHRRFKTQPDGAYVYDKPVSM